MTMRVIAGFLLAPLGVWPAVILCILLASAVGGPHFDFAENPIAAIVQFGVGGTVIAAPCTLVCGGLALMIAARRERKPRLLTAISVGATVGICLWLMFALPGLLDHGLLELWAIFVGSLVALSGMLVAGAFWLLIFASAHLRERVPATHP
ncbi:MAG TPA: hypothetical protein VF701_21785 [Thermoanaerobaculia bacterium]